MLTAATNIKVIAVTFIVVAERELFKVIGELCYFDKYFTEFANPFSFYNVSEDHGQYDVPQKNFFLTLVSLHLQYKTVYI